MGHRHLLVVLVGHFKRRGTAFEAIFSCKVNGISVFLWVEHRFGVLQVALAC